MDIPMNCHEHSADIDGYFMDGNRDYGQQIQALPTQLGQTY